MIPRWMRDTAICWIHSCKMRKLVMSPMWLVLVHSSAFIPYIDELGLIRRRPILRAGFPHQGTICHGRLDRAHTGARETSPVRKRSHDYANRYSESREHREPQSDSVPSVFSLKLQT